MVEELTPTQLSLTSTCMLQCTYIRGEEVNCDCLTGWPSGLVLLETGKSVMMQAGSAFESKHGHH